jgi:hypothetical protein
MRKIGTVSIYIRSIFLLWALKLSSISGVEILKDENGSSGLEIKNM